MKIDELKSKLSSSFNKTVPPLSSNNSPYSYNQPSDDIIKWPLLKSPYFHSHASQFTKNLSFMNLEGDTLIQIQKLWDVICSSEFCQYLSTKKSWPPYKKLKAENYDITNFFLPPSTHSQYATAIDIFEEFSRAFRVHLLKDTIISSLKSPKSHVKLVTHMHYDNVF